MFIVENNKINISMQFELILETKNPLMSALPKFCEFKITAVQGMQTPAIMGMLNTFTNNIHNAGHALQNECYNIFYKVSWLGITDDVKEKLSKMTVQDIETFLDIDNELMKDELTEMLNDNPFGNLLKSILNATNN